LLFFKPFYFVICNKSFFIYSNANEKGTYEIAFHRWLARKLDAGKITIGDAIERFNFDPKNTQSLIYNWRKNMVWTLL
jgi:hypothetical protein